MTAVNAGRRRGRIVVGANDPSVCRYAGLAVTGELARRLRLVELIDAELSVERRARPVKVRRRGLSPGQLVVSLAESQLVGGEFFSDLEQVRADQAGSGLRTVGATPSAPTALQRAKDFRRVHCQRVERACARVGDHLDRALGRDPSEPVTIDLDATQVEVYGAHKQGARRNRHGQMSYAPHVAFWAQTGRALTGELVGGNREQLSGTECARIATRALWLLPAGHGPATFRVDSAYYQLELLERLRQQSSRFTVSVPRSQAIWKALAEIPEDAWQEAIEMPGAQLAETTYRPEGWKHEPLRLIVRRVPFTAEEIAKRKGSRRLKTIHPEQLQLALEGKLASVYGYSFVLTDIHWQPAVWIEHSHRHRAQIELSDMSDNSIWGRWRSALLTGVDAQLRSRRQAAAVAAAADPTRSQMTAGRCEELHAHTIKTRMQHAGPTQTSTQTTTMPDETSVRRASPAETPRSTAPDVSSGRSKRAIVDPQQRARSPKWSG